MDNGEIKKFSPEDISGYGYLKGRLFSTISEENVFAEVIVKGTMGLLVSPTSVYIKFEDTLYDPESNRVKNLFEECGLVSSRQLSKNTNDLKKLVISFNECKGEIFKTYSRKKPNFQLKYGVLAGIHNSSFRFSNTENYEYLQDPISVSHPTWGVAFNFSLTNIIESLSLQQEIHFTSGQYFRTLSYPSSTGTNYYDLFFSFSKISLPLSLNYTIGSYNGYSPKIQLGLSYEIISNQESSVKLERVENDVVFTEPNNIAFELTDKKMGTWFGFGISKSFKKLNAEFFMRRSVVKDVVLFEDLEGDSSFLSIGIIINGSYEIMK